MHQNQLNINGYSLFSKCRELRCGGGVAIYIKDGIPVQTIDVQVPDELECVWVLVRPTRLPRGVSAIAVCAVYITTNSPCQQLLESHLIQRIDHLRTNYPEIGICILGDFNRMNINSIIRGNGLKQVIKFHTRADATLDLILTNLSDHYASPAALSSIGISDHVCVIWKPLFRNCNNNITSRVIRPLHDSGIRSFGRLLQSQDWSNIFKCNSVQEKTDLLYDILNTGTHNNFPTKRIKVHKSDKP